MHCTYIAWITIKSVMKMKKVNYPQVYIEECKYKYKRKKIKMSKFINTKLQSESDSDTELEPKSQLKLDTNYLLLQ